MTYLPLLKPQSLKPGDTIGLISSGFRILHDSDLQYAIERLQALDLKVKTGKALLEQRGYFAGNDAQRAQDINDFFADPSIKGIIQLRGGWGSARLLDHLDYDMIQKNPKIFMGMSDTTSLLLALHSQTGLVTFHGPNAGRPWPELTRDYVKAVLFEGQSSVFTNPAHTQDDLTNTSDRIETLCAGKAQGRLLGGNLAVLTSIMGSRYLPDWQDAILFIEDIGEPPYKIDRMLTQLKLAGVLDKLNGIIIGKCLGATPRHPGSTYGSLRLMEVFQDHIAPLQIPAWYGALISHEDRIFTLPLGTVVEIDAGQGQIKLLEAATQP